MVWPHVQQKSEQGEVEDCERIPFPYVVHHTGRKRSKQYSEQERGEDRFFSPLPNFIQHVQQEDGKQDDADDSRSGDDLDVLVVGIEFAFDAVIVIDWRPVAERCSIAVGRESGSDDRVIEEDLESLLHDPDPAGLTALFTGFLIERRTDPVAEASFTVVIDGLLRLLLLTEIRVFDEGRRVADRYSDKHDSGSKRKGECLQELPRFRYEHVGKQGDADSDPRPTGIRKRPDAERQRKDDVEEPLVLSFEPVTVIQDDRKRERQIVSQDVRVSDHAVNTDPVLRRQRHILPALRKQPSSEGELLDQSMDTDDDGDKDGRRDELVDILLRDLQTLRNVEDEIEQDESADLENDCGRRHACDQGGNGSDDDESDEGELEPVEMEQLLQVFSIHPKDAE